MKRSRTPQEKKDLSYAKDGRNIVAEMRSIAHKAISKRKAAANQALRRAQTVATIKASKNEQVESVIPRTGRRSFRKVPDVPLADFVATKLERRGQKINVSDVAKKASKAATKRPFWILGSKY